MLDRRSALPEPGAHRRAGAATAHAFRARVLALGSEAEGYLRAAAAAGSARPHGRLEEALGLARTRGEEKVRAALERASAFGR